MVHSSSSYIEQHGKGRRGLPVAGSVTVWGLWCCLISISSLVKTGPWTTQHYTALCRGRCRQVLLDLVIHLYIYALFSICLNLWRIRGGRRIIRTCYICERVTLHLERFSSLVIYYGRLDLLWKDRDPWVAVAVNSWWISLIHVRGGQSSAFCTLLGVKCNETHESSNYSFPRIT